MSTTTHPLSAEVIPFWGGWTDAPACLCGNASEKDGFATTDATGTHVADGAEPPHTHFTCLSCGRVATEVPRGMDTTPFERRPDGYAPEERVTIPGAGIVATRLDPPALATVTAAHREQRVWTFFGHWDNDELVVEHYVEGAVADQRVDTGHWEQGLWSDYGIGATVEAAQAAIVDQYQREGDDL